MADHRAIRASSRFKTPTPQPPSKPNTPQAGRATRRRGTRSASRDVELPVEVAKPMRRSARETSVTSVANEVEQAGEAARISRAKRKGQKEATELTTVEEIDTQIAMEDIPNTPPRHEVPASFPHRSPGAFSEMSGTTAISSLSMVEAELLEPRIMIRKLPKLYGTLEEFLNHLVPEDAQLDDDHRHIRDMQKPDSTFSADYRVYDEEATVHLNHFRGQHQKYIQLRAVHRALFGPNRDLDASRCGLDLILYMANLLIFAKQMIHSDRSTKDTWDSLRELDNFFPTWFLPTLILGSDPASSPAGDSALLQQTFELALDLRTQLAILYLERSSADDNFNPNVTLREVFFHSEIIRGWSVSALGGENSALPQAFQGKVIERIDEIRGFFRLGNKSVQRRDLADIDGLGGNFPWDSLVLRMLDWVRSRNRELKGAIENQGGVADIVAKVKTEMEQPGVAGRDVSAGQELPGKKRSSFGRGRRRSGRRFDPNADVDISLVDKLIEKERGSAVRPQASKHVPQPEVELQEEEQVSLEELDDWQPPVDNDPQQLNDEVEQPVEEVAGPSRPPQSTAETLKLLKQGKKLDKENRAASLFDRQANARRVEFGDGFGNNTQPTPGPSSKGKQPERSSPKKRRQPVDESDSEEDDAFETIPRASRVQEQREQAKRVRIDPSSSNAPTSHQPRGRNEDLDFQPIEQEESPSENESPEMTEEDPPASTFANQRDLARANYRPTAAAKPRKARAEWTLDEEEALVEYMALFPRAYAQILKHDEMSHGLLQNRTQVNLKDKVRNMAIVMIKSGTGLRPGFEGVISYNSAIGRKLMADGLEW